MSDQTSYIHGTEPAEQMRLRLMNDLLNTPSLERLQLQGGERLVDFGSGLGEWTRAAARRSGVKIIGIEANAQQIAEAERLAREAGETQLVDFRQGDAGDPPLLDDEWAVFDIAHTRFLLEHVRDPLQIVRQMLRCVKPGGRIILEDDDHDTLRIWPELPGFNDLWRAYIRSYERMGNDPFVGRRLVDLLHASGARPRRNDMIFFGSCSGAESFEPIVENVIGILEGALPRIVELALFDAPYGTDVIESLRAWQRRPDAAFWYTMAWAEGIRPL